MVRTSKLSVLSNKVSYNLSTNHPDIYLSRTIDPCRKHDIELLPCPGHDVKLHPAALTWRAVWLLQQSSTDWCSGAGASVVRRTILLSRTTARHPARVRERRSSQTPQRAELGRQLQNCDRWLKKRFKYRIIYNIMWRFNRYLIYNFMLRLMIYDVNASH